MADFLRLLRDANSMRNAEWDPEHKIDLTFRGLELGGEVGEALNVIKKMAREQMGMRGTRATVNNLAEELADVLICLDLTAMQAGVDLKAAVVAKFNKTSRERLLSVFLNYEGTEL